MSAKYLTAAAVISPCGLYRYTLSRIWDDASPARVTFVMLNPSTADGTQDDPTIRRCVGFARSWGFGGVDVVNLFAFRATSPIDLFRTADPVGPDNDAHLRRLTGDGRTVVAAWGKQGAMASERAEQVRHLLHHAGVEPYAIAFTRCGTPRHPLYLRGDLSPQPFPYTACSPSNEPKPGGADHA